MPNDQAIVRQLTAAACTCRDRRIFSARRIPDIAIEKVNDPYFDPMLNLCFANLVQLRFPLGVLGEIIGGARERRICPASPQFITRCAMFTPAPAKLGLSNILDRIDRPCAVDSHS